MGKESGPGDESLSEAGEKSVSEKAQSSEQPSAKRTARGKGDTRRDTGRRRADTELSESVRDRGPQLWPVTGGGGTQEMEEKSPSPAASAAGTLPACKLFCILTLGPDTWLLLPGPLCCPVLGPWRDWVPGGVA